MKTAIYHNPRCSKSRSTLELIRARNIEPEIVLYLDTPPDAYTLAEILRKLDKPVHALIRTGEGDYKAAERQLAAASETELLAWLSKHPHVIERPIVVTEKHARIGRPPEAVLEILN